MPSGRGGRKSVGAARDSGMRRTSSHRTATVICAVAVLMSSQSVSRDPRQSGNRDATNPARLP